MEQSSYQRLEQFWQSKGLKNATAFAEATGIKHATLSAIKQRNSLPSNAVMLAIQQKFPDISPDYILWGTGPMLRDGRVLVQVAPPGPDYTSGTATQQTVYIEVLKEQISRQQGEIERQQQQIERLWDMLGKSPGSSEQPDYFDTTPPRNQIGLRPSYQREWVAEVVR